MPFCLLRLRDFRGLPETLISWAYRKLLKRRSCTHVWHSSIGGIKQWTSLTNDYEKRRRVVVVEKAKNKSCERCETAFRMFLAGVWLLFLLWEVFGADHGFATADMAVSLWPRSLTPRSRSATSNQNPRYSIETTELSWNIRYRFDANSAISCQSIYINIRLSSSRMIRSILGSTIYFSRKLFSSGSWYITSI